MKQDKDIGFDISAFLESAGNANRFYVYQWQIKNNGCFKIKQDDDLVKVYTPQLGLALLTREIATFDKEQNIETIINGLDYLNSYVEGFKKGEQYFDAKFQVSADVRYGANAEDYVMDIHDNYFHRQHIAGFEGWGFVKSNFPINLTHKRVWEFGYYSGIVNKVEEQVKAHPRIFAKFEKCEHGLPTQQLGKEQGIPNFVNNFDKVKPSEIYNHFRDGLVEKGYLTEKELNEYLKAAFEFKIIPETLFKIKDAPRKAKIEEVFYRYYKNVAGKIHGTQQQYAALLGDYFEGYKTTTVSSNFSKSVY